ncbi:AAA family ATPase [Sphingomonas fuzhouensis]|uniref:AAA family ATPase n=1 Tax=Sphingomonas fuzhouensis TaxID=3106033 RepID=UPI002AFF82C7|nr:AAA family ATPase [Sphingomonas sp. SGZ-02]
MNRNVKPPKPRREPSLLERAANVYDFRSYMRAPDAEPEPDADPVVEQTPVAETPVAPFAPPVPEVASSPVPDIDPSLSAIPPEFLAKPGDEEFLASEYNPGFSDVAMIDRAMLAENGLIVPGAPIGPLAEEFRLVKRQLIITSQRLVEGGDDDRARVVLVCSARPQDGKTFCSVNLALSLAAERDTEVLLVDADVAKPDVLARLGLPDGPGLLDALIDSSIDVESLVMRTDIPHLSVLPCGTKTASDTELLASARTRAVLQRLLTANPRRLVIFDSPPALAASPAAVLAMLAGQVMMVVRADRTPESEVTAAIALLDACDHIQLVLNSVAFVPGSRRFGYYGKYGKDGAA